MRENKRACWTLLLLLGIGLACCGEDGAEEDDRGSCCSEGSDTDTDADSDSDSDTDADQCPDQHEDCIMCDPDPPGSCDDFAGMGSDGLLGCCSAADGDAYFCVEDAVASDDCDGVGCCLETFDGDPAHVCCGSGNG
jgi:hypothetical protein